MLNREVITHRRYFDFTPFQVCVLQVLLYIRCDTGRHVDRRRKPQRLNVFSGIHMSGRQTEHGCIE